MHLFLRSLLVLTSVQLASAAQVIWRADDLVNGTNGNSSLAHNTTVSSWSSNDARTMQRNADSGTGTPTLQTNDTPAGTSVVRFNGSARLGGSGVENPISGANRFTIAIAFKLDVAGSNGTQWYQQTGLVDAEQPGVVADWGTAVNGTGNLSLGLGAGDATFTTNLPTPGVIDGEYHIAVLQWDGATGDVNIFVDNSGADLVSATSFGGARNSAAFVFGGLGTGGNLVGNLAEVRIYSGADSTSVNVAALMTEMRATHLPAVTPTVFSPLVEDVGAVVCPGCATGPLFPLAPEWQTIVGGDADTTPRRSVYVAARQYGNGRVMAFGHEGMFVSSAYSTLSNGRFLRNTVNWLNSAGSKQVVYSSGHGETIGGSQLSSLSNAMAAEGYTFTGVSAPLTATKLAGKSVLIVGNGGGTPFTAAEIEVVRQFVADGGGLCLGGLGWAWTTYHPGMTMDDYPMTRLASPYGVWWRTQIINDPTDQSNGSVRFHVFYPQAAPYSLAAAKETIAAAHTAHGANLPTVLESDAALRNAVLDAHVVVAGVTELSSNHPGRSEIFDFYTELMKQWPGYYSRAAGVSMAQFPRTVLTRERSWITQREVLPLTYERKARLIAAAQLSGRARDLLDDFGIALIDNVQFQPTQLDHLHRLFTLVPAALHNISSVSALDDFFPTTTSPSAREYLDRQNGAIFGSSLNTFGTPLNGAGENPFPNDVPPVIGSAFGGATAHEINHVVDFFFIYTDPTRNQRRAQLISQAGSNHLNYLRSMFADGFFVANSVEFFASIANQWFTDSARTLELGVLRFQGGRPEPLNQALFFAEIYSVGGANTWFYFGDNKGALQRRSIPLTRDGNGRINSLAVGPRIYNFVLDATGNVTGLSISNPPDQAIQVWPDSSFVPENRAGLALVQLAAAPASDVQVSVSPTSGDTSLSITSGSTLTFTPANWNFPQFVSLFAASDVDVTSDSATVTASAPGLPDASFTVTEVDDDFPSISLLPVIEGGEVAFYYARTKAIDDIGYMVEVSTDLCVWNGDPTLYEEMVVADDTFAQTVRVRLLQASTLDKAFLRLRLRR